MVGDMFTQHTRWKRTAVFQQELEKFTISELKTASWGMEKKKCRCKQKADDPKPITSLVSQVSDAPVPSLLGLVFQSVISSTKYIYLMMHGEH